MTQKDLIGTWKYSSPGCAFTSQQLLAQAGGEVVATQIKTKLQPTFNTVGINSSNTYVTFNQDGTFTASIAGKQWSGKYTYDAATSKVTMQGLLLNVNCYAKKNASGIGLLFEASKLLTVLKTMSALSGNTSLQTIGDLAGNYDAAGNWTGKGEFRFASEDDQKRFVDFVNGNDYLKDRRGEYAEAYSHYSPWVHRIDFSYKHDFKLNIGKTQHKLQVGFDMKNVLNFFNSSWGVSKWMNPDLTEGRILKYEGVDKEGFATFSTPDYIKANTQTWKANPSIGQCWNASVGLKYYFN
jgi:hypothetical protein